MSLRCPRCTSEQPFDAAGLDRRGEMVRCAVCGTRWLARPFEGVLPLDEPPGMVSDAVVIEETGPSSLMPPPARMPPPSGPAIDRRLKAAGIVFGIIAALIVLRAPIVAALPEAVRPTAAAEYLEFRKVRSETVQLRGVGTLFIQGEVVNRSPGEVALPAVGITLRLPSGEPVTEWQIELAADTLAAGGAIAFRSTFASPPAEATQVTLNLVARDSGRP